MARTHYNDPTANQAIKNAERALRGAQNRRAGGQFEALIEASLSWYEERELACIEKTPEAMKPLARPNRLGQFLACYTKKCQPDFKGTLKGGRSFVGEAKTTDADKIDQKVVTDAQTKRLKKHHALGAACFVLVSFGFQDFYRIPWEVWRDMTEIYGRKHLKKPELEQYRVVYINGVLKLLEGIELKYGRNEHLESRTD
jgi:recombination protein U